MAHRMHFLAFTRQFLKPKTPYRSNAQIYSDLSIPREFVDSHFEGLTIKDAWLCRNKNIRQQEPLCPGMVIRKALEARAYAQVELAEMLGLTEAQMSYILHGKRSLTIKNALTIESILDIPAYVLLRLQTDYELYQHLHDPKSVIPLPKVENKEQ